MPIQYQGHTNTLRSPADTLDKTAGYAVHDSPNARLLAGQTRTSPDSSPAPNWPVTTRRNGCTYQNYIGFNNGAFNSPLSSNPV